jgi:ATP-dependent DNA helicase RecG
MLPKEKEKIMREFRDGEIQILVATSVIEVGVDVPNATIMMIEGAERFGLSQLHQLRGRVLRSTRQPYCFIFSQSASSRTLARLQALTEAKNGFELAEYDLAFRGPGELAGKKQWGISDVGMEALKNIKMVEAARLEAQSILKKDAGLSGHPLLQQKINALDTSIHFE